MIKDARAHTHIYIEKRDKEKERFYSTYFALHCFYLP
jgi:hypothetical protein